MDVRGDTSAKSMETLQAELSQMRSDFAALTGTLKALAGDLGSDAFTRVRRASTRVEEGAEHTAEAVADAIGQRPLVSLVVAFVVGLLMGLLVGRKA